MHFYVLLRLDLNKMRGSRVFLVRFVRFPAESGLDSFLAQLNSYKSVKYVIVLQFRWFPVWSVHFFNKIMTCHIILDYNNIFDYVLHDRNLFCIIFLRSDFWICILFLSSKITFLFIPVNVTQIMLNINYFILQIKN